MTPALAAAVALLAGAALAAQVVLSRLVAVALWQPYAVLIISLALLGIGASGTALALIGGRLRAAPASVFALAAAGFAVSLPAAAALIGGVGFNPLEVIWDWGQQLRLAGLCVVLAVPFACAGFAIGLVLSRFGARAGLTYFADLVGAGLGALATAGWLATRPAEQAVPLVAAAGALAAGLAVLATPGRVRPVRLAAAALLTAALGLGPAAAPVPSPYKPEQVALTAPGAARLATRSSPLGALTLIASPEVPLRHAPGLGLTARAVPPPQLGLFRDGLGPAALPLAGPDPAAAGLGYLEDQIAAVAYHLDLPAEPAVLVLGLGGGVEVLRALRLGATRVDVLEPDRALAALVAAAGAHDAAAARPLADPRVRLIHAAPRRAIAIATRRWDLVVASPETGVGRAPAGLDAAAATPLGTVEAVRDLLDRLTERGAIVLTLGLDTPPRASLKAVATAHAALAARGVPAPADHLAVIHGWDTATLIVTRAPLTAAGRTGIARFAETYAFDPAHLPGASTSGHGPINQAGTLSLAEGVGAVIAPDAAADFRAAYKFDLAPATDDRPYAALTATPRLVPDLPALFAQGGLTLIDGGVVILVAACVITTALGGLAILAPLAARRHEAPIAPGHRGWTIGFFLSIGFGFMFVEIAAIERLAVRLGVPLDALAIVLGVMLVSAGLGAGVSRRLVPRVGRPGVAAAAAAVALGLAIRLAMPVPPDPLIGPVTVDPVGLDLVGLGAVALAMGLPFPLAVRLLARDAPGLVPWAWAINGCASVTGAVLAALVALFAGTVAATAAAAGLYAVAALVAAAAIPPPAASAPG